MKTMQNVTSTATGYYELKQSTWPRTEHSGGCRQLVVLFVYLFSELCKLNMMMTIYATFTCETVTEPN